MYQQTLCIYRQHLYVTAPHIGPVYTKKPKISQQNSKKTTPHRQKNVTFHSEPPAQNVLYYPKSSCILPLKMTRKSTQIPLKIDTKWLKYRHMGVKMRHKRLKLRHLKCRFCLFYPYTH